MLDPNRAQDRTLNELPMNTASSNENVDPKTEIP